jgi:hypothetical protein
LGEQFGCSRKGLVENEELDWAGNIHFGNDKQTHLIIGAFSLHVPTEQIEGGKGHICRHFFWFGLGGRWADRLSKNSGYLSF